MVTTIFDMRNMFNDKVECLDELMLQNFGFFYFFLGAKSWGGYSTHDAITMYLMLEMTVSGAWKACCQRSKVVAKGEKNTQTRAEYCQFCSSRRLLLPAPSLPSLSLLTEMQVPPVTSLLQAQFCPSFFWQPSQEFLTGASVITVQTQNLCSKG